MAHDRKSSDDNGFDISLCQALEQRFKSVDFHGDVIALLEVPALIEGQDHVFPVVRADSGEDFLPED